MAAVERKAREKGCCKLTLEVQENNVRARRLYRRAGFRRRSMSRWRADRSFLWKLLVEE